MTLVFVHNYDRFWNCEEDKYENMLVIIWSSFCTEISQQAKINMNVILYPCVGIDDSLTAQQQ